LTSTPAATDAADPDDAAATVTSVVFDFGGVLITPITRLIDEIAGWHGVSMVEMLDVLMGPREVSTADHPWHRAERGELPTSAMQEQVVPWAEVAGITLRGDEYERVLCGDFEVRIEVLERIALLREQGYRTGLLTNSFEEFRPELERRIDFGLFDVVVDSSEVGCRKPEPEIYELSTRLLGDPPAQILYLDDFAANLVGAAAAGWQTIHVTGSSQSLAALDAALE
jgi:epoxide hydrolase-like predicted phosphatase